MGYVLLQKDQIHIRKQILFPSLQVDVDLR
jgi:hypothetical protein